MSCCCVVGCKNRYSDNKGLTFFRIPTGSRPFDINRRNLWLRAIKRSDWTEKTIRNSRVCSDHFISGKASSDSTSPDFVPSLFSYSKRGQRPEAKIERYMRKRKREEMAWARTHPPPLYITPQLEWDGAPYSEQQVEFPSERQQWEPEKQPIKEEEEEVRIKREEEEEESDIIAVTVKTEEEDEEEEEEGKSSQLHQSRGGAGLKEEPEDRGRNHHH